MKVRLKEWIRKKSAARPNGSSALCEGIGGYVLEPVAMMKNYGSCSYLVFTVETGGCMRLDWAPACWFEVVDSQLPADWIQRRWSWFHPMVKRNERYDFDFRITRYDGPPCILEDENFLFEVIEERDRAMEFYKKLISK